MKITAFQPSQDDVRAHGLGRVNFRRLGDCVVLAGPNGGGKSRILLMLRQIAGQPSNRKNDREHFERRKMQIEDELVNAVLPGQRIEGLRGELESVHIQLERLNRLEFDIERDQVQIFNFVPKQLNLRNPGELARDHLILSAEQGKQAGVDNKHETALAYIQLLQDRYWHVTHPRATLSEDEKSAIDKDYSRLNALIALLLGQHLDRNADDQATLFGFPVGAGQLSDGQKILIQLAVAVHPFHGNTGFILILDEPENHLHPAALITVLDKIRQTFPESQLWIATHSVPLISHLYSQDQSCLHFVENGSVTFAGSSPEKVLAGLLGGEEERQKLHHLLDLPAAVAATNFAAACLAGPAVVGHTEGDSQIEQIKILCKQLTPENGPLRILDIGAGKGRLLAGLLETTSADKLDYVAFDISDENKSECMRHLIAAYSDAENRWSQSREELIASRGTCAFDVVVMCNVLHEISPRRWLDYLGPKGFAYEALAENGNLLIVEDLRIPHGELPNPDGFFLLSPYHLQKLFKHETGDLAAKLPFVDLRGDERLTATLVPKNAVLLVNKDSIRSAIEGLSETAKRKLESLRNSQSVSYKTGLLNALWSQLYTNSLLFLEQL